MSDLIKKKEKILFQYVFDPGVVSVWQSGVSNCRFTLYRTLIDTLTHFTLLYIDTLLYRTLIDTLPNSLPIFLMGGRGSTFMAFAAEMWIEAFENTLFIGLGRQRKISKSRFVFCQKDLERAFAMSFCRKCCAAEVINKNCLRCRPLSRINHGKCWKDMPMTSSSFSDKVHDHITVINDHDGDK